MNQAIKRVWIALTMMFVICLAGLSYIQFFSSEKLAENSLNKRQLFREFDLPRGAILVDGKPIAESVPTDDGQFTYQRRYNDPQQYAHLTGYYSLANGSTHLESELNDWLTGSSSDLVFDRLTAMFTGQTAEGASVELTIDGELQKQAYEMIPDGLRATIVVTDPKTGDILAMASKPSYDPNDLAVHSTSAAAENMKELTGVSGLSPYVNPAIGHLVAPGSSFKILSTVAALESGEYDLDTMLDNPTKVTLPGTNTQLGNFEEGICARRPQAQLEFIFTQSCNTPFVGISEKLGAEPYEDVTERFGFGQQLNIPQSVTASEFPTGITASELAMSTIGQFDTKATPLEMNMVAMAIANDGVIMQPNMVDKVIAPDLRVIEDPKPKAFSTATTKEVANTVADLMKGPVTSGTAMNAAVPGVDLRAKTGTAQVRTEDDGTPIVNSWITGFAPGDDPQVAITVNIEQVDYNTGHNTAGSLMKKMTEAVFNK
ncbi:penicillin-binding transpeptidase domain-containing protein [Glutamicibacter sp. AOP12-B1-11]|uniref:penicillin-binding transpeptidase domain-containing protein n=1 Tax=Glutamicibacter sp. AOP12-B1-11 TaxID=3457725 RepID=UPI0040344E9E